MMSNILQDMFVFFRKNLVTTKKDIENKSIINCIYINKTQNIMAHYARTYGSKLHPNNLNQVWQFPTSPILDIFGVKIPAQNKTFGLEEFNLNSFYIKNKMAYIPCYGTARFYPRQTIDELRLIYRIKENCYCHYATLYKVKPFLNNDIPGLRQIIQPQLEQIYFRIESQLFFGEDSSRFQKKIQQMFASNLIADNQNDNSFLVNVKYERIEILDIPIYCKLNSYYAGQWKIKAENPSICK